MKPFYKSKALAPMLCLALMLCPIPATAEDIDIFTGASAGKASNPHILFVLDNTSNWSRASQKWPGGITQGQAEVKAIKDAINSLGTTDINIGLLEYVTGGNDGDTGGFVRFAVQPMVASAVSAFSTQLDIIYNDITGTTEKRSGAPYGNLMRDAYNYYAGASSVSPAAVLASKADSNGYTTNYTRFKSPLSADNSCARAFVIFIGNPSASGPDDDVAANTTALAALGGNTTQIPLPYFAVSDVASTPVLLGKTLACYASKPASAVGAAGYETQCDTYTDGCSIGNAVGGSEPVACPTGNFSYEVIGTQSAIPAGTVAHAITSSTAGSGSNWTIGVASHLYANGASVTISGCAVSGSKTLNGTYTISSPTANSFVITKSGNPPACGSGGSVSGPEPAKAGSTTTLGYTSQCYASSAPGTCFTTDYVNCSNGTYTGGCACSATNPKNETPGCPVGENQYEVLGTDIVPTLTPTGTTYADTGPRNADEWSRFIFDIGVPVASGVSSTQKFISTYTIDVFNKAQDETQTSLFLNMAKEGGGKYFAANNDGDILKAIKAIVAEIQSINSTFASASLPVSATNRSQNSNQVFIGMFRPDPEAKPRWFGNLKQYQVLSSNGVLGLYDQLANLAENPQTGFLSDCAVSFWTTNSRTDTTVRPWASTYYWENIAGVVPPPRGLCPQTTLDDDFPAPPTGTIYSPFSDMPDGPFVEKGAVAEVLRKGNNPSAAPTWAVNRTIYTIATTPTTLIEFNATNAPLLNSDTLKFTQGYDMNNETGLGLPETVTRASIHGDVIHSRPLAINYGTPSAPNAGVTTFYGSNDGMLRAVIASGASAGKELWAFTAPEFSNYALSRNPTSTINPLERLRLNNPLVNYPVSPAVVGGLPRDYFFDGSAGLYQNIDNSKVWIYPSMRRGGRMIYGLDVTHSSPTSTTSPKVAFKWRVGCPKLTDNTDCTDDMSDIGQTWSTPNVALTGGYSIVSPYSTTAPGPVIVVGGGYDTCEDADTPTPSCSSDVRGNNVYVLDATTGAAIRTFNTLRPVPGDVALIDVNNDGNVDYAFAADTGGNLYRINFVDSATNALASSDWAIKRVAYTNGGGRKFLYTPSLLASQGKVYLAIGSGNRERPLASNYPYTTPVTDRLYVYLDDLARGDAVGAAASTAINLDDTTAMNDFTSETLCTQASFASTTANKGWFMNFPNRGEQGVTSALIAGGLVTISTNQPVPSGNTCATNLGIALGYWVNLFNGSGAMGVTGSCGGTRSAEYIGGGLPPSAVLGTVPVNGVPTTICIGCPPRDNTKGCSICPTLVPVPINSTRKSLYWKNNLDN